MLPPFPDPTTLALAISFLLAAYLTDRCWTPPNPDASGPTASLPHDKAGITAGAVKGKCIITLSLWMLHVILTLSNPRPPTALCPDRANLSRSLFTWSPYTISVLAIVATAAPIRLLAFRHLGQNFTFRLAKPAKLVKNRLYAHVQHPSYPTSWLVSTANVLLLLRLDGLWGCVLPRWVVRWGMESGGFRVWPALLVGSALRGLWLVWVRVKDEEAMLKREFGREWEEHHRRTARFVTGVF